MKNCLGTEELRHKHTCQECIHYEKHVERQQFWMSQPLLKKYNI